MKKKAQFIILGTGLVIGFMILVLKKKGNKVEIVKEVVLLSVLIGLLFIGMHKWTNIG